MPEQQQLTTEYSDEELARTFQRGEKWAFNILVQRYKDALVNFAYRYTGNQDDAEDIVQDTFIRVYNHVDQFQPIAKFSTWLYTIATNLARTHYRKRRKWGLFSISGRSDDEVLYDLELPDSAILPDQAADSSILHEKIEGALLQLAPSFREVIILFEIEEKSYEEICEITGLNIGTVKSRLNRARAKLQTLLHDLVTE